MGKRSGFQIASAGAARYEYVLGVLMAPFVDAVIDAVSPRPGQAVLDLACGTGFVARAVAPLVEPGGCVVGVDRNPDMLGVAAEQEPSIDWCPAPAEQLPFADDRFDAAVCQQGFQFFPDAGAAAAELWRVLRPGGRVALTMFAAHEPSPYFVAQREALRAVLGDQAAEGFGAAFSPTADRAIEAMMVAGFHQVEARIVNPTVTLPPLDPFAGEHLLVLPWGAPLEAAGVGAVDRAIAVMVEVLADHTNADCTVTVPFGSWLVTARS